jgi:hypothetical protein
MTEQETAIVTAVARTPLDIDRIKQVAAEIERSRVVEWLRSCGIDEYDDAADAIEIGCHVRNL